MGAVLTACLHQEQLMATISLLWKANFCWKPCGGKDKTLREFPHSFPPFNRIFPPPREMLTKRPCLQLEPFRSLQDSPSHPCGTREAIALCRGVPITQGSMSGRQPPPELTELGGKTTLCGKHLCSTSLCKT